MKFKVKIIKKQLNERFKIHSKMSSPYILNNIINPNSPKSIFNKKLIFYDLETNGFMPNAYVHQIAALDFNLGDIITKSLSGQQISNEIQNLTAEGGVVVKSKFDLEDFKEQDKATRKLRDILYNKYCKNPQGKDPIAYSMLRSLFSSSFYSSRQRRTVTGANYNIDPRTGATSAIKGAFLCITDTIREANSQRINNLLNQLEQDNVEIDPYTKGLIDKCVEKEEAEGGSYSIKSPQLNLSDNEESDKQKFFEDLYNLFSTLSKNPYNYTKRRGRTRNAISEEFKKSLSSFPFANKMNNSLEKAFLFTYSENKNFTEYENFPLQKYERFYAHDKEINPTEADGIKMFLNYLRSLGKNNYILVGHNIKSFDNNVILGRAKKHGISKRLIDYFQDSEALDTMDLLGIYTKQMEYFQSMLPSIEEVEDISPETKSTAIRSQKGIEEIIKMNKKLGTKLDGMMKVFEETKEFEQTHTADDDCEKLAQVMVRALIDMYEMDAAFQELSERVDLNDASIQSDFSTFVPQRMTPAIIRNTALTKIVNDLAQVGLPNAEEASELMGEEDLEKAKSKAASKFGLELVKDIKSENPEMTEEDLIYYINNLKTSGQTGLEGLFKSWMESKLKQKRAQNQLDFSQNDTPEDQVNPDNLSETILNKWKKMIK